MTMLLDSGNAAGTRSTYAKAAGCIIAFFVGYDLQNMAYLQMPAKTPAYRQGRGHAEFLCRLKEHFPIRTIL